MASSVRPESPQQTSNEGGAKENKDKTSPQPNEGTTKASTGTTPTGTTVPATPTANNEGDKKQGNLAAEKVLSVSANLAKLLPSGAVLVFQTLSASFTNQGTCETANKWLSALLVGFLTTACIFLTFTDSIFYNNKTYYGVATASRLRIFAVSKREEKELLRVLRRDLVERRLKPLDWVHAVFTAIVFISIAMGDVGLQKCFFPDLDEPHMKNVKEVLRNAPLGLALLSSFVFMIFPTTRHGVGFDNNNRYENRNKGAQEATDKSKSGDIEAPGSMSNK
ncbi:hypothetical protein BAE44_0017315 [Dichanthelium oligosanthes]|uniref:Uncharacterized protein n=1 Tax=Dichanthelium oligosanthes TaxID=888268 RepID=A0A1E5V936_9POAL|nr:hypothetical protein BAE44_0017315 [Dichanthelium oligosanthes]